MQRFLLCSMLLLSLAAGCTPDAQRESDPADDRRKEVPAGANDDVTWIEKRIKHQDVAISLGYRDGYAGGRWVQPVTVITRSGKPVANAMVFNRLISLGDSEVTAEDAAASYESSDGDATYVGTKLRLLDGATKCAVSYRIVLPHQQDPWTRDVTIEID